MYRSRIASQLFRILRTTGKKAFEYPKPLTSRRKRHHERCRPCKSMYNNNLWKFSRTQNAATKHIYQCANMLSKTVQWTCIVNPPHPEPS